MIRRMLRRLAPGRASGTEPVPDGGLLNRVDERDDWQGWLAQQSGDVLGRHPRVDILRTGASLGSYLAHNPDVADAVTSATEAVFHLLEFGVPEDRRMLADTWNADFVAQHHGLSLSPHLTAPEAAAALADHGIAPADAALSERDLWLGHGLHGPALVDLFHPEFYLVAVESAGLAPPDPTRAACIAHYLTIGLEHGVPPHPDHRPDDAFYRAGLAARTLAPPPNGTSVARHWAGIGLRHGVPASASAWGWHRLGRAVPEAVLAQLPRRAPALQHSLDALLTDPKNALRLDLTEAPALRFVAELGRYFRNNQAHDAAERVLRHALFAAPNDPRVKLDLADLIHGASDKTNEEARLRRGIPMGFDSGANQITLAELELQADNPQTALRLISDLPTLAKADETLMHRRRSVAHAAFDQVWNDLTAAVERHGLGGTQDLLSRAIRLLVPHGEPILRSTPIRRVAILTNDDLYQCKLYRADQKADQLRTAGLEVQVFLQSTDVDGLATQLDRFDAVIFQRNPAFAPVARLIVEARNRGLVTFYDIDDLIFDRAAFPPPLDTYAGQITAEQHRAMACGVPLFEMAARLCDYGLASTPTIAEALAPLTGQGRAFLHRNALGQVHMAAIDTAARRTDTSEKVVIFYGSGTKAHKGDFRTLLEPALARVLDERPGQVELRLMGDFPDLIHIDRTHPDVHLITPIWDFEAYAAELSEADIALSVLAPSLSADAKSELKWTEAAMFGIPCVLSPTATMRDVVEDGKTGFFAQDADAFAAHLLALVDDAGLRQRIGQAARDRVMADYALPAMADNLRQIFSQVRPAPETPKSRLLVVNVFYPPQDIGGATQVAADITQHLLAEHSETFEIDVLTTLHGGSHAHGIRTYGHGGARVHAITASDAVDESAMRHPITDARVEAIFDKVEPDIVHVHCIQRLGMGIIDLCRRRGIPYVLMLHDGWWVSPHQFILGADGLPALYDLAPHSRVDRPERARLAARCLDSAAAVIAVSEPFAQLHRDAGVARVCALENGVPDLPAVARTKGPDGRVRLGHIGGAARHKGYHLLQAAIHAADFRHLDLTIVDHGLPPGTEITELWRSTPVRRIARRAPAQVAELYGTLDVLLAPSIWPESYGLVTREAAAAGLWVVASDRGAIGGNVRNGIDGHIVDVTNHHALADCLRTIDAAPERYRQPPQDSPDLRTAHDQAEEVAQLLKSILGRS